MSSAPNSEAPISQPPAGPPRTDPAQPFAAPAAGLPKASGLRVATGVVAIVVAVIGVIFSAARLFSKMPGSSTTPYIGWMTLVLVVGVLGMLVTGVVILAKQRKRTGSTPWLIGSFAALIILSCLGLNLDPHNGTPGAQAILIPLSLAVVVLAGLVILIEKGRR